MALSDGELFEAIASGHLVITPFDDNNAQPSSVDLRLDPLLAAQRRNPVPGMTLHPDELNVAEHVRICSLVVERLGRAAEGGYQGMFQGG